MKQKAVWFTCSEDDEYHSMKDFCSSCAPFWDTYPTCPNDGRKLNTNGYCKDCKKYYDIKK